MIISNCCGVEVHNDETDICPKCKEHCEYIEICDECGGEGVIEIHTARGEEGMMIEMDIMVECPECNGKKITI